MIRIGQILIFDYALCVNFMYYNLNNLVNWPLGPYNVEILYIWSSLLKLKIILNSLRVENKGFYVLFLLNINPREQGPLVKGVTCITLLYHTLLVIDDLLFLNVDLI